MLALSFSNRRADAGLAEEETAQGTLYRAGKHFAAHAAEEVLGQLALFESTTIETHICSENREVGRSTGLSWTKSEDWFIEIRIRFPHKFVFKIPLSLVNIL